MLADNRAKQRSLAHAVAAEHAGDLAGLDLQRDAAQCLGGAVEEVNVVHFQHRQRPR